MLPLRMAGWFQKDSLSHRQARPLGYSASICSGSGQASGSERAVLTCRSGTLPPPPPAKAAAAAGRAAPPNPPQLLPARHGAQGGVTDRLPAAGGARPGTAPAPADRQLRVAPERKGAPSGEGAPFGPDSTPLPGDSAAHGRSAQALAGSSRGSCPATASAAAHRSSRGPRPHTSAMDAEVQGAAPEVAASRQASRLSTRQRMHCTLPFRFDVVRLSVDLVLFLKPAEQSSLPSGLALCRSLLVEHPVHWAGSIVRSQSFAGVSRSCAVWSMPDTARVAAAMPFSESLQRAFIAHGEAGRLPRRVAVRWEAVGGDGCSSGVFCQAVMVMRGEP